jgi:pimeloyl-ACP methyl ester carboxylesterase
MLSMQTNQYTCLRRRVAPNGDARTRVADQAALLEHLKLGAVNVVGWSDGGIEALLLAIRYGDDLPIPAG